MMIKKLGAMMALFFCVSFALAANQNTTMQPQEIAATVVKVSSPVIDNSITKNNATEAFMQIDNQGRHTHEIVAAYSPIVTQIQLHKTIHHHSQMKMRQVRRIKIKPRHDRNLKLGGLHLMLIGLKQSLKTNQMVPIILIFHDGSWMTINARVVNNA